MVITIDGGTFLGKSSISKRIAERLGFLHISSGVIYKTLVYKMLEANACLEDIKSILMYLSEVEKNIKFLDDGIIVYNGEDISKNIENDVVYSNCYKISGIPEVKSGVERIIRSYAKNDNIIVDGRETGTLLFPNADFKFFFMSGTDRFSKATNVKNINVLRKKNEDDEKNGIVLCPKDAEIIDIDNYETKMQLVSYIVSKICETVISKIDKKRIDVIIPARSGSVSCKNKNIRLLGGIPLMAHSINVAKKINIVSDILVSTDSLEYAEIGRKYGAEIPFIRPMRISGEKATDLDFFKHAIFMIYSIKGILPEYIIHLRPTTPIRDKNVVQNAVDRIICDCKATSLRSAHKCDKSPYKMLLKNNEGYYVALFDNMTPDDANKPRQEFPEAFIPNGYVDVVKTAYVISMDRLHGDNVIAFETEKTIDVDTENDFLFAEKILSGEET